MTGGLDKSYPTPRDFGVPHDEWRERQYAAFRWLQDEYHAGTEFAILESGTGCGKTGMVTGLSTEAPLLALVSTLGLGYQYRDRYGYAFVPGRQEHKCVDPEKIEEWKRDFNAVPSALDCHFSQMHECPYSQSCPYLVCKRKAQAADKVVLTYKYASLARWPRERGGILVCDEGHGAAEEVLALAEFRLTGGQCKHYDLAPITDYFPFTVRETLTPILKSRLTDLLIAAWRATAHFSAKRADEVKGYRFHLRLKQMIDDQLPLTPHWFIEAGPSAIKYQGRSQSGLILRPLDAKPVAHRLWQKKAMTILMSATIGNPAPLADELGIETFAHRVVPHVIPVDKRPVYKIFRERMTKGNLTKKPGLYLAQAAAISHFINNEIPADWRGIILTTSYFKIGKLREHLRIGDRLWNPPQNLDKSWLPVTRRIEAFLADPREGIVAVDTLAGWGHGLDLRGDLGRFVVVAGVQHANPADPYDNARKARVGGLKYQRWLAYNGVMQACGRVTRGEVDEAGEYLLNVAALADGGATTKLALGHFSPWFLEAMQ